MHGITHPVDSSLQIEDMVQSPVTPCRVAKGYEEKKMRLFSVLAQALGTPRFVLPLLLQTIGNELVCRRAGSVALR